jgi:hypothetical protein
VIGPELQVMKTPTGEYRRQVTKIAVIYLNEGYGDDDVVIGGGECCEQRRNVYLFM